MNGYGKVSEVPELDTFAECATTGDHIVVVVGDIDTVSANGSLVPERSRQSVGPNVPEAHLTVPRARYNHIRRLRIELACEDLVCVSGVDFVANLLDSEHAILVVDFNIGLCTGDNEPPRITAIVDSMIAVFLVDGDVFDGVALV